MQGKKAEHISLFFFSSKAVCVLFFQLIFYFKKFKYLTVFRSKETTVMNSSPSLNKYQQKSIDTLALIYTSFYII